VARIADAIARAVVSADGFPAQSSPRTFRTSVCRLPEPVCVLARPPTEVAATGTEDEATMQGKCLLAAVCILLTAAPDTQTSFPVLNPDFGQPSRANLAQLQTPRQIRLGIRYEF
jgi:hypothetical protein